VVARHPVEELEHLQVIDTTGPDLLDELPAVPDEAAIL
jgi:hypothetical protein